MTVTTVTSAEEDERLLVDLLNSTPMDGDEVRDDLEATIAWREWVGLRGDAPAEDGQAVLASARKALQGVVRGTQAATSLRPFLRGVRLTPAITESGVEWSLDGSTRNLVAARAVLAWDQVQRTRPGRLRACQNPDCRLFLLDRSKGNTGRWCSMETCGNRMKARRHYEAHGHR
jgi:predicted RNA-binding Zn ribbon-like protein